MTHAMRLAHNMQRAARRAATRRAINNAAAATGMSASAPSWPPSISSVTRLNRTAAAKQQIHTRNITNTTATSSATPLEGELAADDPRLSPRESMDYDVVVVGGGPAGLSAAIRLKQLAAESGTDITVCVVEKGAEIGSHILSGNVFDPRALDELLPEWRSDPSCPIKVEVKQDKLYLLTEKSAIPMPVPPSLHNDGNFIISLSQLTRWLASQAESLGVDIFPGFAASELLYNADGAVCGIATKDVGIGKDGLPKDSFTRGMELRGSQTILAEGTRGSLSELAMEKFSLRQGSDPQTYGLGIKEIWEIAPEKFEQGKVQHTIGWPSPADTWSGTFLYHFEENKVLIGLVVGLDYSNTYISPYQEMQKFKTHPMIKDLLTGGRPLEYGARVINEGGLQSLPTEITFPGGALVGCAAGFLNVPRIKGSHMAIKTGMLAAEAVAKQVATSKESLPGANLTSFSAAMKASWVYSELHSVRNYHPSFHKFGGLWGFMAYSGIEAFLLRGREPWTFRNSVPDHMRTKPAAECTPIEYPKPDGVITFDLLTNLQRSAVKHNDDQPSHLKVRAGHESTPIAVSWNKFKAPETRFCPARVYEVLPDESNPAHAKLQINNTNCVHCKTCAIKTPELYIDWTVPEGGGGPNYQNM